MTVDPKDCHHALPLWHVSGMMSGTAPAHDGRPIMVTMQCENCELELDFSPVSEAELTLPLAEAFVDGFEEAREIEPTTVVPHPDRKCRLGLTDWEVEQWVGAQHMTAFHQWIYGQTRPICEGAEPCEHAHGMVTYSHDVLRFMELSRG